MNRTTTADTVIENINMLLAEFDWSVADLSEASKVPVRTIYSYLSKERKPAVDITDQIASGFGLHGWHLLMPNLKYEIAKNGHLEKLIDDYTNSSIATQGYVDDVLQRERKRN